MALFQIFRGEESNLDQVPLHAGYAYFCVDTQKLWIDIASEGNLEQNRLSVGTDAARGFIIDDEFVSADQFVQIGDISEEGVLIGDGTGAVQGVIIPDRAIVIGDGSGGIEGVEVRHGALLVGDSAHGVSDVVIHDKELVVGNADDGVEGVAIGQNKIVGTDSAGDLAGTEVTGAGILYALSDKIPTWGVAPVVVGGTGRGAHVTNAVLTGNNTDAVNNVETRNGAFFATENGGTPQFGILQIAQGGVGANTAAGARENLDVYAKGEVYTKTEVDNAVSGATSIAYYVTLEADGWIGDEAPYSYVYGNVALRCGSREDVPPLITPDDLEETQEDYGNIGWAEATARTGITFYANTKPTKDIKIIIVDAG